MLAANIPRGVLGLLFDQKFGLLMYAPVYLLAPLGCWMMFRQPERRLFALVLLTTVIAFVAKLDPDAMMVGRRERAGAVSGAESCRSSRR